MIPLSVAPSPFTLFAMPDTAQLRKRRSGLVAGRRPYDEKATLAANRKVSQDLSRDSPSTLLRIFLLRRL